MLLLQSSALGRSFWAKVQVGKVGKVGKVGRTLLTTTGTMASMPKVFSPLRLPMAMLQASSIAYPFRTL